MIDLPLHDPDGKAVGTLEVDETVFGDKVRRRLLQQVVVIYEANRYRRTASTLGRGEVAGSGRKIWPQKHTGRARMGSIRSPIWKGGGVVFGPKPSKAKKGLPQRMRREALRSALLGKLKDKEVVVIQRFALERPSTKRLAGTLKTIGLGYRTLIGVSADDPALALSARNLPRVNVTPVRDWNAYDVLRHRTLLVTREALQKLGPEGGAWIREKK